MTPTMSSSMHWFSCETKQVLAEVSAEEINCIMALGASIKHIISNRGQPFCL